jgi:hypothetical protein
MHGFGTEIGEALVEFVDIHGARMLPPGPFRR